MNHKQLQFEKDIQSQHSQLFLQARDLLLSFEGINETKKERITTYSDQNGGICHLRTTKDGVDIGYLKGAKIDDTFGQLHGKTKKMRVQSLAATAEFSEEAIRYYVRESIRLNHNA